MHFTQTLSLGLAFAGLCTFSIVASKPAAAQNLVYTLSSVTFSDGSTGSGYFDFNPTTRTFGTYDITTTNGTSGLILGGRYAPETGYTYTSPASNSMFDFFVTSPFHELALNTELQASGPGTYLLVPGTNVMFSSFIGSGEFSYQARGLSTGSLIVTNANPVPEVSTTVSFGLLLVLGLGGAAIAVRKKKALAQD